MTKMIEEGDSTETIERKLREMGKIKLGVIPKKAVKKTITEAREEYKARIQRGQDTYDELEAMGIDLMMHEELRDDLCREADIEYDQDNIDKTNNERTDVDEYEEYLKDEDEYLAGLKSDDGAEEANGDAPWQMLDGTWLYPVKKTTKEDQEFEYHLEREERERISRASEEWDDNHPDDDKDTEFEKRYQEERERDMQRTRKLREWVEERNRRIKEYKKVRKEMSQDKEENPEGETLTKADGDENGVRVFENIMKDEEKYREYEDHQIENERDYDHASDNDQGYETDNPEEGKVWRTSAERKEDLEKQLAMLEGALMTRPGFLARKCRLVILDRHRHANVGATLKKLEKLLTLMPKTAELPPQYTRLVEN